MSIFKGSGVALITPFKLVNEKSEVDYDMLKKLCDMHVNNGTDAIIICGTTGESATLSHEEHEKCIKKCIEYVNGKIPVIAGTGSNDTNRAIELSKKAETMGADALLCVTPYYNKTNQEGLINYYTDIAKNVDIPIIMYNVPSRTGVNIEPNTAYEIALKNDNVVAIKEASGNISQITKLASLKALDIYSGNDDQIVPILSVGGIGVISVLANIFPRETHDMVMTYLDGDVKGAMELQLASVDLCNALFSDVNPIPVKKAMEIMYGDSGIVRKPLIKLSEEKTKVLKKEIDNFNKTI